MSKLARATALTLGAFVLAALLDYAFVTGMSWMLSPRDYGALGVAMTWFLLLSFFVASGFPMSLAKVLAEGERPPPGLVRFAMRANLVVAGTVALLFLGLTFYGPLSPGPGYGRLVWGIALALVLLAVGSTLQFALQGRMSFSLFALLHASKSLNKVLFGIALVALGFGLAGALSGLVVGGLVLILASWGALRAVAPDALAPGHLDPALRKRYLAYTLTVFAGSFALTLMMSLDLLGLKYLAGHADVDLAVAQYQAATILTKAPLWAVLAGLSVLFPLLSRASRSDPKAAARLLRTVLRWTILLLAPVGLVLAAFPDVAMGLMFPDHYVEAAPLLAASVLGMLALSLCLILTRALQATDRARAPGAYLAVSVALQAALLVALVPRWGAMGAAVATSVAATAGAVLALGASARVFRLRVGWRDAAALAVSLALLGAIVAAIAPTTRVGAILALAAGTAAYAVSATLLGLVRRRERRALLRRLLPRLAAASTEESSTEA